MDLRPYQRAAALAIARDSARVVAVAATGLSLEAGRQFISGFGESVATMGYAQWMKGRHANRGAAVKVQHLGVKRANYRQRFTIPYRSKGYLRTGGAYGRFGGPGMGFRELKWHDFEFLHNIISIAGEVEESVNKVQQGTGQSQRVGNRMLVKSVSAKFRVQRILDRNLLDTGMAPASLRIIVYIDKQCNGATATVSDLLEDTTHPVQSYYEMDHVKRFRILLDKVIPLNHTNLVWDANTSKVIRPGEEKWCYLNKRLALPIVFSSTTGAITEIQSNNIGFMTVCNENDQIVRVEGTFRLRFLD